MECNGTCASALRGSPFSLLGSRSDLAVFRPSLHPTYSTCRDGLALVASWTDGRQILGGGHSGVGGERGGEDLTSLTRPNLCEPSSSSRNSLVSVV